jgi:hypothetical protein
MARHLPREEAGDDATPVKSSGKMRLEGQEGPNPIPVSLVPKTLMSIGSDWKGEY